MPGGTLFNATTSKIEHTTKTGFDVSQFTILAHYYAASAGENNFGRLFCADENNDGFHVRRDIAAGAQPVILFTHNFSGVGSQLGAWYVNDTLNAYHAFGVTYDRGATTNVPIFYLDDTTPTVTTLSTPIGTAVSPSSGYCIGNRSASDRTWDGGIMHLQFHPTILSAANVSKALRWPGSVKTTGAYWWAMLNQAHATGAFLTFDGTNWVSAGSHSTVANIASFTTARPNCAPVDQLADLAMAA